MLPRISLMQLSRLAICVLLIKQGINCENKRWLNSMDLGDPLNYNTRSTLCERDHLTIQSEESVIFLQDDLTVQSMIFPINGEIRLGDNSSLNAASNNPTANCIGKDVMFIRTEAKSWFDPENWCSSPHPQGSCQKIQPLLLDSERIPCEYDHVHFPVNHLFKVDLGSNVDIHLAYLTFNGKNYNLESFRKFLESNEGKEQFPPPQGNDDITANVNIMQQKCSDKTGCGCGNDKDEILTRVCHFANRTCPQLDCVKPIDSPIGHCCSICGAVLTMNYDFISFHFEALKHALESIYIMNQNEVNMIMSKTYTKKIQVVLRDDTNGSKAAEMGREIEQYLTAETAMMERYGLTTVSLKVSLTEILPPTPRKELMTITWIAIGSGGSALIILLLIIPLIFIIRKKRNKDIAYQQHLYVDGTSFDNPLYTEVGDSSLAEDASYIAADDSANDPGLVNPLHGKLGLIEEVGTSSTMKTMNPAFDEDDLKEGDEMPY